MLTKLRLRLPLLGSRRRCWAGAVLMGDSSTPSRRSVTSRLLRRWWTPPSAGKRPGPGWRRCRGRRASRLSGMPPRPEKGSLHRRTAPPPAILARPQRWPGQWTRRWLRLRRPLLLFVLLLLHSRGLPGRRWEPHRRYLTSRSAQPRHRATQTTRLQWPRHCRMALWQRSLPGMAHARPGRGSDSTAQCAVVNTTRIELVIVKSTCSLHVTRQLWCSLARARRCLVDTVWRHDSVVRAPPATGCAVCAQPVVLQR